MRGIVILMSVGLAGCNQTMSFEETKFAEGRWEVSSGLVSRNISMPPIDREVDLSAKYAKQPPKDVFFSQFYRTSAKTDGVVFSNGKIEGQAQHPGVTGIRAQSQVVSGTYTSTTFKVMISSKPFGAEVDEIIEGKRVSAAH